MTTVQTLPHPEPRHDPPATLGDVLHAGQSRPLVLESEWAALVQCVAAGDQQSLHALYARAHRVVFTVVQRITGNRETAEEVTLDVFHDVWKRASGYDAANGTVLGWIMNQARSRAIDRLRFEQRIKRAGGEGEPLPESGTADRHDVLESEQERSALISAFTVLTLDERRAIEAAYFSELTYAEVATQLDQPLGTIKTRIRSGLNKLRRVLAEQQSKR